MSTCLESQPLVVPDLIPRKWAWPLAAMLPLVLVGPWLLMCRRIGVPAEIGTVRILLLGLLILLATVTDLLRRRIYNWTTYTVFVWIVVLELLAVILSSMPAAESETSVAAELVSYLGMLPWRQSLAGFAVGFALMFVLYNLFRGGAGDLKLIAVLGALVGVQRIIEILIYAYIVAGIFAACLLVAVVGPVAILAFAAQAVGLGGRFTATRTELTVNLKRQVPMAPFLALGTLIALILP